jgi:hypothetical protein
MIDSQNRARAGALWALIGISCAAVLGALAPAIAAPGYDGLWSVVIITEKGTCDRAYRYPVRISRGTLVNAGDSPVAISGKVGGNGAVNVTVSYGDKSASGSGRLSGDMGMGSWSGGACAGTWEAERRG